MTPYTLHPAPYTPTLYTLHSTPYTLQPTPYTPTHHAEAGAGEVGLDDVVDEAAPLHGTPSTRWTRMFLDSQKSCGT